jgi:hypothetical protein
MLNTISDISQGSQALEEFVNELVRRGLPVDDHILLKQIQSYAYEGNGGKML